MNSQIPSADHSSGAPILVTGGTGRLGSLVTAHLRRAGCTVRVLSRHPREDSGAEYLRGDLLSGDGVERAVAGVETVIHLAGAANAKGDDAATGNLVRAASRARVRHLVHISVIGADHVPLGYFRSKRAAEQSVLDSGIPFSMLRAAQVHELVLMVLEGMAKLPLVPVPRELRFQPVDAGAVAGRLAHLALGAPAGMVDDIAGPEVLELDGLLRDYFRRTGRRRVLVPVRMPGKAGAAYRAGANLSAGPATLGGQTWADFLAGRLGSR